MLIEALNKADQLELRDPVMEIEDSDENQSDGTVTEMAQLNSPSEVVHEPNTTRFPGVLVNLADKTEPSVG